MLQGFLGEISEFEATEDDLHVDLWVGQLFAVYPDTPLRKSIMKRMNARNSRIIGKNAP